MKRIPLQKFSEFTNTLLPHEVDYLYHNEKFESVDRQLILSQVYDNVHHPNNQRPYSADIDKRKYNHIQKWIKLRLNEIDVDQNLKLILSLTEKITNDTIQPSEEKKLFKLIVNNSYSDFYFTQFYNLALIYRRHLLFRLRKDNYEIVDSYIKEHEEIYKQSIFTDQQLDKAAYEIINENESNRPFNDKWAPTLKSIFTNDEFCGQLRFRSFLVATFICYHNKDYDVLTPYLNKIDKELADGKFYSKRILLNFYNVKLMFYAHHHDYKNAIKYGELATKTHNEDSILYVNNLCAIYLKLERYKDAIILMEKFFHAAKESNNFHYRISFIAFYIKTLYKNDMMKKAINYGSVFLDAYKKEILKNRWFLFFSFYFEVLLKAKKYSEIIYQVEKNKLLDRSQKQEKKYNLLPIIPIMYYTSLYKTNKITKEDLETSFNDHVNHNTQSFKNTSSINSILDTMSSWLPELRILYMQDR